MVLRITPKHFEKFPNTRLGVVSAHGINNQGQQGEVLEMLGLEQATNELAKCIKTYCSGEVKSVFLGSVSPQTELGQTSYVST